MRPLLLFTAWMMLGGFQAAPSAPEIATAEFGWFVPQGPRVESLGEISSRRAILDETHRTTEILFFNSSGNPDFGGKPAAAVRLAMRIDCRSGDYVITEHVILSMDDEPLQTTPVDLLNLYGPMDLIIGEVCGGPAASDHETFESFADYIRQSIRQSADKPRGRPIPGHISGP